MASSWPAKRGGTLLKLSTFLSQLKGGPLAKKQIFEKKLSQCRKTEKGDPSGFLNTHSVTKHQKIEGENFLFSDKNLTMPKKLKGGTLWDFSTSILSQNSKKIEGGLFVEKIFRKMSRSAEKK